ncbi:MAG: hypothetical protein EON54_24590 [Alcaligenaceae bacterium]|nr:MAG: hypothetical protein EON54_24590 [Alcaligenaceae bacterium]
MRTDRAFENHMWAELSRNADILPESSRPYAAALVEAEIGLHTALRMQLHDRLLRFGELTRAERHDDLVLALAAKRRGDEQEAGRVWADIKYHDEVDAANAALRWMAGLPGVLAMAAASAPPT